MVQYVESEIRTVSTSCAQVHQVLTFSAEVSTTARASLTSTESGGTAILSYHAGDKNNHCRVKALTMNNCR